MKRITVSLPDELADRIKAASGGERQVSAYVVRALEAYEERESLDDILADWDAETPVPEKILRQVEDDMRAVGFDIPPWPEAGP